jgi:hypothetical protein
MQGLYDAFGDITTNELENMVDAFYERYDLPINHEAFLKASIDQLQIWRPDITDEVLAEHDILRGRDFVMIQGDTISRGVNL